MNKQAVHMLVSALIVALAFNEACTLQEGHHLNFTMSPDTIVDGLTDVVKMRCDVDESMLAKIEVLKITWEDWVEQTVASITPTSKLKIEANVGGLKAEGSAQGASFIELTWFQPKNIEKQGTYKCKMIATNTYKVHLEEEEALKMNTRDATHSDIVEKLAELQDAMHIENGIVSAYNFGSKTNGLKKVKHVTFKKPYIKLPKVVLALRSIGERNYVDSESLFEYELKTQNLTKEGFDVDFETLITNPGGRRTKTMHVYGVQISWISIPEQ